MSRVFSSSLVSIALVLGALTAVPAQRGWAQSARAARPTQLSHATLTRLRNQVQLQPAGQPRRAAKPKDELEIGDRLSTGRSSLAEFRFNEGTVVRMGERAVFRFVPRSRQFLLNQGTALLLIPPGQGRSQIQTPSVRVGIRGSALFVRHSRETRTTLVGALTSSGIEVSDTVDGSVQWLEAGQMLVAVDGKIRDLYDFDLATFYATSALGEGILEGAFGPESVLEEIRAGLAQQGDFADPASSTVAASPIAEVIQSPDFVRLADPAAPATTEPSVQVAAEVLRLMTHAIADPLGDGAVLPGRSLSLPSVLDAAAAAEPLPDPVVVETPAPLPTIPASEPPLPEPGLEPAAVPQQPAPNPQPEPVPEPEPTPEPEPAPEPEPGPPPNFPGQGIGVTDGPPGQNR